MAIKIQGTTVIDDSRNITNLGSALSVSQGGTGLTTTPSNGQLLIGNAAGYTLATLTAGANIVITNSSGAITITALGGGGEAFSAF